MSREALPGVFDTIEIISISLVVGGLLGVAGYFFINFWYREKKLLNMKNKMVGGKHLFKF